MPETYDSRRITELTGRVITLEGAIQTLVTLNKERHEDNVKRLDQIIDECKTTTGRVSTLEIWKAKLGGQIGVVVAVCSCLSAFAGTVLAHYLLK